MTTLEPAHRVQRFDFASFDKEPEAAPAPTTAPPKAAPVSLEALIKPPPELAVREQDLQAARAEAKAQGYREGYGAAEAKMQKESSAREEAVRALLDVIANRITIAAEAHAEALKEQQKLMERLVLAVARKIAGDAIRQDPYAGVESLLRECAALINGEPKIVISASPAYAQGLRQRIDTIKPKLQGFEGEITVADDSALFDQDCRVEWKNGYGERSIESLWNDIEAIIARTAINP